MSAADQTGHELSDQDQRLIDLVTSALVDPNLHTDLRMRLANEIARLLRVTPDDAHPAAGRAVHQQLLAAHASEPQTVLAAVLADPNLHTDMRMRIYNEISQILRGAHDDASGGEQH